VPVEDAFFDFHEGGLQTSSCKPGTFLPSIPCPWLCYALLMLWLRFHRSIDIYASFQPQSRIIPTFISLFFCRSAILKPKPDTPTPRTPEPPNPACLSASHSAHGQAGTASAYRTSTFARASSILQGARGSWVWVRGAGVQR